MAAVGKRQTRPVLSPHAARTQTTRHRTIEVGDVLAGHGIDIRFLTNVLVAGREPFAMQPELSPGVLAAALFLTVGTGLLFGLAPALQTARVDPMPVLKESRSGGPRSGAVRFGLGQMLVVSQMAIFLLLLVGAGLFVRTLTFELRVAEHGGSSTLRGRFLDKDGTRSARHRRLSNSVLPKSSRLFDITDIPSSVERFWVCRNVGPRSNQIVRDEVGIGMHKHF